MRSEESGVWEASVRMALPAVTTEGVGLARLEALVVVVAGRLGGIVVVGKGGGKRGEVIGWGDDVGLELEVCTVVEGLPSDVL